MIALVDCNNFYASCEKIFRPDLLDRPVIVLSNNDGCVVARSAEAKALGIAMGVPAFEIKDLVQSAGVVVFSSNYSLYGDMSDRVATVLRMFTPDIEVYSIDESFLDLSGIPYDLTQYAAEIRARVQRWTGITVSVGIAATKTLAKVANKIAKKSTTGIHILQDAEQALASFPVGDLWGIGRKYGEYFAQLGITTALQLRDADPLLVRKKMHVWGDRMQHELKGIPCIELEHYRPAKQNICTSRSFGKMVTMLEELSESVSTFAANCARKLRADKTAANLVTVFVHTNPFREDLAQHSSSRTIRIPIASNNTLDIQRAALQGLRTIYREGYHYKKSGVIVSGIEPEGAMQYNLFHERNKLKADALMKVLDKMNSSYGRGTVRTAAEGYTKRWKLKQEKLSPRYTTRITDIPRVRA